MITYKTRNRLIVLGAAAIVILIVSAGMGKSYNRLVKMREEVKSELSQIDNQLQRRSDLIPNLVETVKNYAAHETAVFESIAEARAKLAGASQLSDMAEASAEVSRSLGRLLAIAEGYPELEANRNFVLLQDELAGTENRIAVARRDYNKAVQEFNTAIGSFPASIYAPLMGFREAEYFEVSEGAADKPDVGAIFGE